MGRTTKRAISLTCEKALVEQERVGTEGAECSRVGVLERTVSVSLLATVFTGLVAYSSVVFGVSTLKCRGRRDKSPSRS